MKLTCGDTRSDLRICAPNQASRRGVPPSRPPLVSRPLPLSRGGAARDWTDCQLLQPYAGKVRQQRGDFGLVSRQRGDGDRLQSLPALPPRRATSCRALVDHVPDHPAQGEQQPAQPRKAPALAAAPRTPGGERAHRQPGRRRQAKRPNARSTHPSTLPSAGGQRCPGTFE